MQFNKGQPAVRRDGEIIDLRNLRDFVVLFFSRKNEDKLDMADIDRMSAITAVIDKKIIEKGGEV